MAELLGADGKQHTLPLYRSHKIVSALEIAAAQALDGGLATLAFKDPEFASLTVEHDLVRRYFPVAGDYLIIYDDGYRSISPRRAFIEGYERLEHFKDRRQALLDKHSG